MITKNIAETATVSSSARGMERCGSWLSSPIEAAASKPTNSRMPSSTPPSTPPPLIPSSEVSFGLNML